jgi:hypothetical protein
MAALLVAAMLAGPVPTADAASHREAPLVALDPTADITDVYAFRSWENDSKAVFIMNVIPQQVPASGPNFFNLDDKVRYSFHLDLDRMPTISASTSASRPRSATTRPSGA